MRVIEKKKWHLQLFNVDIAAIGTKGFSFKKSWTEMQTRSARF